MTIGEARRRAARPAESGRERRPRSRSTTQPTIAGQDEPDPDGRGDDRRRPSSRRARATSHTGRRRRTDRDGDDGARRSSGRSAGSTSAGRQPRPCRGDLGVGVAGALRRVAQRLVREPVADCVADVGGQHADPVLAEPPGRSGTRSSADGAHGPSEREWDRRGRDAIGAAPPLADEVDDEQPDERDQHPLRAGQPERLGLVATDELDEETEDPRREQVQLQRVARHRDPVAVAHDQHRRDDVEGDLVQHRRVHRQVAAGAARRTPRRPPGRPSSPTAGRSACRAAARTGSSRPARSPSRRGSPGRRQSPVERV